MKSLWSIRRNTEKLFQTRARRRYRPWLEILEDRVTPNSAPVAIADSYEVHQGDTLNLPAEGVLENDTDADQDLLEAIIYSYPDHASYFLLNSDGSVVYQPELGFAGTDEFWYTAYDGLDHSAPVKVTVEVTNTAPVAVSDEYDVHQGDTLNVPAEGVLANDTDADQDPIEAVIYSQPSHASYFLLNSDGSVVYQPEPEFSGTDEFWYTAFDGADYSDPVKVTVDVTNTAPVAEEDYYWTIDGQSLSVSAANGLLVNDSDADDDPLTVEVVSYPTYGSYFNWYSDGSFDYVPTGQGADSFTYRIFDGAAYSALITVNLAVQAQPAANQRIWTGGDVAQNAVVSPNWNSTVNWLDIDGDGTGDIAGPGHDVIIDLAAPNVWYPQVDAGVVKTVRSIRVNRLNPQGQEVVNRNNDPAINPQFANLKQLQVVGDLVLTGAGGQSNWSRGHINVNGVLEIKNEFLWRSGEIRSANGAGVVNVFADPAQVGAKMKINATSALEATLNIGQDLLGTNEGNGEVELVDMNGNLTIRKNADINVGRFGVLAFNENLLQAGTEGGIVRGPANALEQQPFSPNSEINNRGMVSRSNISGRYVLIEIPLINDDNGMLIVENRSAIRFDAQHRPFDVLQNDGMIEMHFDSELIVPNGGLRIVDGNVLLKSDPVSTDIRITGFIEMTGGIMTLGDQADQYVNLIVSNFIIRGGEIRMRIDGSDGTKHDSITTNSMTVNDQAGNNATLDITVVGALTAELHWDIFYFGVGAFGTDFVYDFNGNDLDSVWFTNYLTLLS